MSSWAVRPFKALARSAPVYPLTGICYFVTHSYLWPAFRSRLIPCLLLSTFILVNLFVWTYLPQVAFLALLHHTTAGAWINGTVLVLSEGAVLTSLLAEIFLIDATCVTIFDAVLTAYDLEDLVTEFRPVAPATTLSPPSNPEDDADALIVGPAASSARGRGRGSPDDVDEPTTLLNPLQRLGKLTRGSTYMPFSCLQISEFIFLLPLLLIPVAGTPLFMLATGYRAGPLHHYRYFKMRDLSRREKKSWIARRRGSYTGFGAVSLALQLIPVADLLFVMTNTVGSALWVVDLERQRRGPGREVPAQASESDAIVSGRRTPAGGSHGTFGEETPHQPPPPYSD